MIPPSPKLQNRLVIVPVEVSVNVTVSGTAPLVGVAVKLAAGTTAPVPVSALVEFPPLALTNSTALVKPPTATGANCTTTLIEAPQTRLNVLPEIAANGPPVPVPVPLVTVGPPLLVPTNTR